MADFQNFRLVMPSPYSGADICQTLLTSSILGYPVPTLVGYNGTATNATSTRPKSSGMTADRVGHHATLADDVARITGVLDHLTALPSTAGGDLVLIMDPTGASTHTDHTCVRD